MRRFLTVTAMALVAFSFVAPSESDAFGRFRRRHYCPPVYECPPRVLPPAPVARRIIDTNERNTYDRSDILDVVPFGGKAKKNDGETFRATARKVAKLSVSSAKMEHFATLGALLDSLPTDESMNALKIGKGPKVDRVAQEERNVTVDAYLYAACKEDDNDYHLILGTAPSQSPRRYMNVELSGLPEKGEPFYDILAAARTQFKDALGGNIPGMKYRLYDPPYRVRLAGSLFYDTSHPAGTVGPKGFKPESAWEIHPITSFILEPADFQDMSWNHGARTWIARTEWRPVPSIAAGPLWLAR